jgi:hypothetical protein
MNAVKVYQDQMAKRMRGTALYEPRWEVYIGDVGYFRQGRFMRLFNVTLDGDHPLQRINGVPATFEPLQLSNWSRSADPEFLEPQVVHSKSVRTNEIEVELE